MDEDTCIEQGLMWKDAHWAYLHIFESLGVDPDLLLLGTPTTDEFQHQFMALTTPKDIDGNRTRTSTTSRTTTSDPGGDP